VVFRQNDRAATLGSAVTEVSVAGSLEPADVLRDVSGCRRFQVYVAYACSPGS
jgi:hypothetical protein